MKNLSRTAVALISMKEILLGETFLYKPGSAVFVHYSSFQSLERIHTEEKPCVPKEYRQAFDSSSPLHRH